VGLGSESGIEIGVRVWCSLKKPGKSPLDEFGAGCEFFHGL